MSESEKDGNKDMAARLEALRMKLGLDYGQLANRLGISRSMLGFLRTGTKPASPKIMRRISDIETVDTSDLRNREAEALERIGILKKIYEYERAAYEIESTIELLRRVSDSREEARQARAEAAAAEESLRLERERRA